MPAYTQEHIKKAVQLIQRIGNAYDADEKLKGLFPDLSKEDLAALLWEIFTTDEAGMRLESYLSLLKAKPAENAEQIVTVLTQLSEYWPDGTWQRSGHGRVLWLGGDVPGFFWGLYSFLEAQKKPVLSALIKEAVKLPRPYDQGVLFTLGCLGVLQPRELPPDLLPQVAASWLKKDRSEWPWPGECPWPDKEMARALVKAASQDGVCIRSGGVLGFLAEHASDEDLVKAATKTAFGFKTLDDWKALLRRGPSLLPHLEKALLACKGKINFENVYDKPCPVVVLLVPYLELCKQENKEPPASLDPVLSKCAEKYEQSWSGGDEEIFHDRWLSAWKTLPPERLEKILTACKEVPWYVAGACPRPAILERVFVALEKKAPSPYSYEMRAQNRALSDLGAAKIPYIIKALNAGTNHKSMLVGYLTFYEDEASLSALAGLLRDKSKPIREAAINSLSRRSPEKVLPLIKPLASAKNKDTRLSVARILAALPVSTAVATLANEMLAQEKIADIKKSLEAIKSPEKEKEEKENAAAPAADPALVKALQQVGNPWQDLAGHGTALLAAYWEANQSKEEGSAPVLYGDDWRDMLLHFANEPETLGWIERTLPICKKYKLDGFLTPLAKSVPGLVARVAKLTLEERFSPPPGTRRDRYSSDIDEKLMLEWLAEQKSEEAIPALVWGLSHKSSPVQKKCAEGLLALGEKGRDALLSGLSLPNGKTRLLIAGLMTTNPSVRALPVLEQALAREELPAVKKELQLAIDKARAYSIDPDSFPKDAQGEKAFDAALAGLKIAAPSNFPKNLPALKWKSGAALSEGAQAWFLATLAHESRDVQNSILAAVRARLDDASAHALSEALAPALGTDKGPGLYMLSVIGSPAQLEALGADLETHARSQRLGWGEDGVEVMVRANSDISVRWLDHWYRKTRSNALRLRSDAGLTRLAKIRGVDRDEMIDDITPHFGFDRDGKRTLDYGPRSIEARLDPEKGLYFIDEKGKESSTLPGAKKTDDAAKVSALKEEFKGLKQRISQLQKVQGERLEAALQSGRRWSFASWKKRFLGHPLTFPVAKHILFLYLAAGKETPFAVSEKGEIIDVKEKPLTLPEEGEMQLLHPAVLSKEERDLWEKHAASRKLSPPFEQMSRTVFTAADIPKNLEELWLALPKLNTSRFLGNVNRLRYQFGPREDAGLIHYIHRERGGYRIAVSTSSFSPEIPDLDDIELTGVSISRGGEHITLFDLPPIILSETVRDLYLLAGKLV